LRRAHLPFASAMSAASLYATFPAFWPYWVYFDLRELPLY
jgi:hypothetical protein